MPDHRQLSVAFSGALFAWPYQAGVAAFVQQHGLVDERSRIYGTSSGSVVAVMLACGIDIARVGLAAGLEANLRAAGGRKNPLFRPANVIATYFKIFGEALPADAHVRASGRLFVRVTKVRSLQRILISQFATKQALLDALGASIAIPGITVTFAHKVDALGWCIDGGPEVPDDDRPEVHTIRVGVGPRIPGIKPDHITPSQRVGMDHRVMLLPVERRRELFELGFADASRYLATEAAVRARASAA